MADIEPIYPPNGYKTEQSKMLWLSMAYADASLALCEKMIKDDSSRNYFNTRVILYLSRHAFELFLKAAIWSQSGKNPSKTHRLDKLHIQYQTLFPHEKYALDPPFTRQILEDSDAGLFPGSLTSYQNTHDQRFRYSHDASGDPFEDQDAFDVLDYEILINRFRIQLQGMILKIDWGIDH